MGGPQTSRAIKSRVFCATCVDCPVIWTSAGERWTVLQSLPDQCAAQYSDFPASLLPVDMLIVTIPQGRLSAAKKNKIIDKHENDLTIPTPSLSSPES